MCYKKVLCYNNRIGVKMNEMKLRTRNDVNCFVLSWMWNDRSYDGVESEVFGNILEVLDHYKDEWKDIDEDEDCDEFENILEFVDKEMLDNVRNPDFEVYLKEYKNGKETQITNLKEYCNTLEFDIMKMLNQ